MKLDKYNRNTMDAILNNIGYVKNHNGLGYHKKCFAGVAFIRQKLKMCPYRTHCR